MHGRPLLYLLAFVALSIATENRKIHRLVGGHLRIINPYEDDAEFMKTEASGSRDKKQKSDHDEKKTLSQQVADGKYALIQKELFSVPPKRPGVLSYEDNPEVPKDNESSFGGLNQNEIWLAENHLLVIKGGLYPPHEEKHDDTATVWPAIDNFKAPLHQVKIPAHPKVPPPFPVQFTDNGPLQILGTNSSRTINETEAGYAIPPPAGFEPNTDSYLPPDNPNTANVTPWQAPVPNSVNASGEYHEGVPFPPYLLNGTLPPYFASLPPGAAILPPPDNQTDIYDEDDPSIYYPPPYSFYYPKDNSSAVPPGPLVPGIILPPPPNFFGPLDETTSTVTSYTKAMKPLRQRKPTTTEANPQIHPTTTPLPPTETTTRKRPFKIYPVHESRNEIKPTVTPTATPDVIKVLPVRPKNRTCIRPTKPKAQRKKPQVTVLTPVKPSTPSPVYTHENEISNKPPTVYSSSETEKTSISGKPLAVYGLSEAEKASIPGKPFAVYSLSETEKTSVPEKHFTVYSSSEVEKTPDSDKSFGVYGLSETEKTPTITTTQVPLSYYTTSNEIENYVTPAPIKIHIAPEPPKSTAEPAQYYFYEEGSEPDAATTPQAPQRQNPYFDIPNEYYIPAKPMAPVRETEPQYIYVNAQPYNAEKPKFRFVEQPAKTDTFSIHIARLQNQINQYYTTPRTTYRPVQSSKPIYQFSFQAANYRPQQNRFKPSQPDLNQDDQFRPLPKYSVQIEQTVEIIPTESVTYQQSQSAAPNQHSYQKATEKPRYYYTTSRPNYSYQTDNVHKTRYSQNVDTPRPITQYSFQVTPNPIYQGFYTKPDEGYFDDNTKKYFTIFGKKLQSSTSPLPTMEHTTPKPNFAYNHNQQQSSQYQQAPQYQKPISLETDTMVNYVHPRPQINPEAETLSLNQPITPTTDYPKVVKYPVIPPAHVQEEKQPPFRAENADIIKAVSIEVPIDESREGSFISYQLPGDDGAHFYFLTPQLAQRKDQGVGYYYSQPDKSRIQINEDKDKER